MKITALKQLQATNPSMYNAKAIDLAALKAMGWSNPEQFLASPDQQAQVPPEVQKAMAEIQILKQEADAKSMVAQASVQEAQVEGQARMMDAQTKQMLAQAKLAETQGKQGPGDQPWHAVDSKAKMMDAETRRQDLHLKALKMGVDLHESDRESEHREADRMMEIGRAHV